MYPFDRRLQRNTITRYVTYANHTPESMILLKRLYVHLCQLKNKGMVELLMRFIKDLSDIRLRSVRELMLHRQNKIFAVAASNMLAIDVREVAYGRVHPYNYQLKVKDLVSARSIYT